MKEFFNDVVDILMIAACIAVIAFAIIVAVKYSFKDAVGISLMGGSILIALDAVISYSRNKH